MEVLVLGLLDSRSNARSGVARRARRVEVVYGRAVLWQYDWLASWLDLAWILRFDVCRSLSCVWNAGLRWVDRFITFQDGSELADQGVFK